MNDRTSEHGWRLRELSGDEELIELLPRRVFPWLEQLLGEGEVVAPTVTSSAADPDPRGKRLRKDDPRAPHMLRVRISAPVACFVCLFGNQQSHTVAPGMAGGWPMWGGHELRGMYCNLPQDKNADSKGLTDAASAGAHIDPEPMHLVVTNPAIVARLCCVISPAFAARCLTRGRRGGVVVTCQVSGYVDHVPKNGGGFAVFPGSHRLLYEAEPASADLARYSVSCAEPAQRVA